MFGGLAAWNLAGFKKAFNAKYAAELAASIVTARGLSAADLRQPVPRFAFRVYHRCTICFGNGTVDATVFGTHATLKI